MREYKTQSKEIILTTTIDTPLGEMFAAASKKGIVMLCYFTPFNIEARIDILKKSFDTDVIPSECEYFEMLRVQLEEYFKKSPRATFLCTY
jgi:O6-methylguanine-DNA--protein-cysteine methyltransferase